MAPIGRISLDRLCNVIAEKYALDAPTLLKTAAESLVVEPDSPRLQRGCVPEIKGSSSDQNFISSQRLVGLRECGGLPPGKNLAAMTLTELSEVIANTEEREKSANVIPFLLRIAGGEFHYGQRVTPLLPGQKVVKDPSQPSVILKNSPSFEMRESEHKNTIMEAFDVLASEAQFKGKHLHQVAGWVDLTDKQIWDAYVADVVGDRITKDMTVFEAGCGVLAFLQAVKEKIGSPDLVIGGNDGAKKTVELVKSELAPEGCRGNFYLGMLPESMDILQEESWDVVLCNSVFQYIIDKEAAKKAVEGMIRVAKKWVIIADVCDARWVDEVQDKKENLEWASGLPEYRVYEKGWWIDQFSGDRRLVSIRHVECEGYKRRRERYTVYIEKI